MIDKQYLLVWCKWQVKYRDYETSVRAKSDRLRNHNIKYGAVTKNTPYKTKRLLDIITNTKHIDKNITTSTDEPATKKIKVHRAVDSFCTKTDAKTKVQLDKQIAKAFYACNIPFNVTSHP